MELCVGQVPEHTGWPATPHCAPGSPIAALVFWSILAADALLQSLDPGPWVVGGLVAIALYFVGLGLTEKRWDGA